jgi:molybdenum cofactor cytidylyltransferase
MDAVIRDEEKPGAVVIMLCDQPLVTAAFLDRLATIHQSGRHGIVAAEYGGSGGVPALFDRALFPELMALRGAEGAKPIIVRYAKDARWIPFPEAAIDIDSEDDVQRLANV